MRKSVSQLLLLILPWIGMAAAQQPPDPPQRGSSKWGAEDQRGAANLLTSEKVLEAVSLVKKGQVYQLGRVYEESMPLVPHRHFSVMMPVPDAPAGKNQIRGTEALLIAEIGQVGTQFDGMGHFGIGDIFYNGYDRREFHTAKGLSKLGIENAGAFLTRGVLLDIAGLKGTTRLKKGYEITAQDLRDAMDREKVKIHKGDAVLIHTGWGSLWKVDNDLFNSGEPGIGVEAANFLVSQEICMVGSDSWATEVIPNPNPDLAFPVHQILIPLNGIYNLENLDTSSLVRDRVYEFAFFFAPLRLKGFAGSPGNPVAIR